MNNHSCDYYVKLRAIEPEDVDFILDCEKDKDSGIWSDYRAPFSRNQLLTYALTYDADPFRARQLRLIITDCADIPLGILDLYEISEQDSKAFIGICIHPAFRRKHYGFYALKAAARYASNTLGLNQLLAKVALSNSPARELFIANGYEHIAILPQWHRIGKKLTDFHLFSLPLN